MNTTIALISSFAYKSSNRLSSVFIDVRKLRRRVLALQWMSLSQTRLLNAHSPMQQKCLSHSASSLNKGFEEVPHLYLLTNVLKIVFFLFRSIFRSRFYDRRLIVGCGTRQKTHFFSRSFYQLLWCLRIWGDSDAILSTVASAAILDE